MDCPNADTDFRSLTAAPSLDEDSTGAAGELPFMQLRRAACEQQEIGNFNEAIAYFQQALNSFEEYQESDTQLPTSVSNFKPFVLNELGIAYARHGNLELAVRTFDCAIQILCDTLQTTRKARVQTHAPDGTNSTSVSISSDGAVTIRTCDETGCQVSTVTPCPDSDNKGCDNKSKSIPEPGTPCNTMCLLMETKKHLAMALKIGGAEDAAMALFCELLGVFSEDGMYANKVLFSDVTYHLTTLLNSRSEFEEAEPLIRKCVEVRRKLWGDREDARSACEQAHGQSESKCTELKRYASESASEIALALCMLGVTIASPTIGKYEEAEESVKEAILIMEQMSKLAPGCGDMELRRMHLLLDSIRAAHASAIAAAPQSPQDEEAISGDPGEMEVLNE